MIIQVDTNAHEISRFMRDLFRDQLPFATSRAVRLTALDVQQGQRQHQHQVFTVRRPLFVDRAVKITQFPTKTEPTAEIAIEPPGGKERADVLTRHEEGGLREPGPGHRARAIPEAAQTSPTEIVPRRLRPKQLGFVRHDKGAGSFEVFRGKLRTFMIRRPDGRGVILQRLGRGPSDLRALFILKPGGVQIQPRLKFFENAERIVGDVWDENFAEAWNRALETAR